MITDERRREIIGNLRYCAEMCRRYLNGHFKLPLRVLFNMATVMKMEVDELVAKLDECGAVINDAKR